MNTLSISPASLPYLDMQATLNGTFIHLLRDKHGVARCTASVVVEQCEKAIAVRVYLGDSRNSITLRRGTDAGMRIAMFVEEIANGVAPSRVPELDEQGLISGEEQMLRDAIRTGCGTYSLSCADDIDLELILSPATSEPKRSVFRFAINGVSMTLPVLLPADRQLAYELLSGCVRELIANYRCGAAA